MNCSADCAYASGAAVRAEKPAAAMAAVAAMVFNFIFVSLL
jgi:hypothetical protein